MPALFSRRRPGRPGQGGGANGLVSDNAIRRTDCVRSVTQEGRGRRDRWAAASCLVAVLASLSWVRMVVLLVVAAADGSHSPLVAAQDTGFSLVLRHRDCAVRVAWASGLASSPHRHGFAANLLLLLADDPSPETDHVLQVGESAVQLGSACAVSTAPQPCMVAPVPAVAIIVPGPGFDRMPTVLPRPPPGPPGQLAQLRATVLLI